MGTLRSSERIKSFEEACLSLGLDPTQLPVVVNLPEKDHNAIIAFYKLTIITRALNEGWEPNWTDLSEWKYFNYLYIGGAADDGSICGLSASDAISVFSVADTGLGARLAFKSRELAEYAYSQFKELFWQYVLIDVPEGFFIK
ncbi:MAG: hypothetical protein EOM36_03150 [Bacteroidia bacterium]|nr:hypothetical protein [Bacteroidia bacterium]